METVYVESVRKNKIELILKPKEIVIDERV